MKLTEIQIAKVPFTGQDSNQKNVVSRDGMAVEMLPACYILLKENPYILATWFTTGFTPSITADHIIAV